MEIVTKRGSTPGGRLSNEIAYTLNARAWFVITPNAPGPFSVQVSSSLEKGLLTTMDITGVPAVPIVPTSCCQVAAASTQGLQALRGSHRPLRNRPLRKPHPSGRRERHFGSVW